MAEKLAGSTKIPSLKERRQRNREIILEASHTAAIDLINEEGLAALNLHEVARRVNMSAQALMKYYASKADLYDTLFRLGVEQLLENDRQVWSGTPPDWERIRLWLESRLVFARRSPGLYDLATGSQVPGYIPQKDTVDFARSVGNEGTRALQEMIDAGVLNGAFSAREMMNILLTVIRGIVGETLGKELILSQDERFSHFIPEFMTMFQSVWSRGSG